jgi:hypothetical protein
MATRRYFQSVQKWTPDRDDAYDFEFISKAMRVAHKLRIADLELVLSLDDTERLDGTSVKTLLHRPSQLRRNHFAGGPASERAVPA